MANWIKTKYKDHYLYFSVMDTLDTTDCRRLVFMKSKKYALWTFSMNVQLILMKD